MNNVTDVVRPFAKTEFDKWLTKYLSNYEVYRMDQIVERRLSRTIRDAVFWPFTNRFLIMFEREFGI